MKLKELESILQDCAVFGELETTATLQTLMQIDTGDR